LLFSIAKGGTNGRERIIELRLESRQVAEALAHVYKSVITN
jgi:hypothetical protein